MPGNSQRKGAVRKKSRGSAPTGSGGQRRRALEGKGPTPKAEDRTSHPAQRRAALAAKSAERRGGSGAARGSARTGRLGQPPRAADGTEYVAGRNPVVEALRADIPANALYVGEGAERDSRLREALQLAVNANITLLEAPRAELDRLTQGAVHQGLVLAVPPYEYAHPEDLLQMAADAGRPPLIVALDSVTDPRNLGAVIRSAAAFGATGVLIPERRSASLTASAWKTSAGAAARLPVAQAKNLTRALQAYADTGLRIAGLDMDGDVTLAQFDEGADPLVLVIGAEDKGLSRLVAESCDVVVSIPMSADQESLNASVAASIVLYEIARQRGY